MAASQISSIAEALARTGPFGFGASSIGNLYKAISDQAAANTIDACWNSGLRYFDTAPFYGMGLSEKRLGDALRARPRADYIVSTKVGRLLSPLANARDQHGFVDPLPFEPIYDYSYDGVMRSFEQSLIRLDLERIDILYMHDLGRLTHGTDHERHLQDALTGGLKAMQSLKDQGLVAAIGLGVNEIGICRESFAFGFLDLFMLAGRYSLLDHAPLDGFFDECRARGTAVVSAGIFNSGILATGTRGRTAPYYDYQPAPAAILARVEAIERICDRFHIPLAAAAFQFVTAHPAIAIAVVGTASPARIAETRALAEQAIPSQFWWALIEADLIPADAPLP